MQLPSSKKKTSYSCSERVRWTLLTWDNKFWYAVEALRTFTTHSRLRAFSKCPCRTVLRFSTSSRTVLSSWAAEWIADVLTLRAIISFITLILWCSQTPIITVIPWSAIGTVFSLCQFGSIGICSRWTRGRMEGAYFTIMALSAREFFTACWTLWAIVP